jgi:pimeloyl-ACP methyl ester carboxylesterase
VREFAVQADGAELALREWGDPEAAPLLFWHALGPAVTGAMLGEVAPTLAAHGLRVLALDAPGFGRSPGLPPERYRVDALVRLVCALLDSLELDRVVFMGHSWGGSIGVYLAAQEPVRLRALVLLDSGHVDWPDLPEVEAGRSLEEWIAEAAERPSQWDSWSDFVAASRPSLQRWNAEIEDALRPGLREVHAGVESIASADTRGAAVWGLASTRQSDTWPAIAAAGLPVLLLTATEPDDLRELNEEWGERFGRAVPLADIRAVPQAGHTLFMDVGPPLADEIGRWLRAAA